MNKKLTKWFAIISIFIFFCCTFFNNNVLAMTNTKYGSGDKSTIEVDEDAIIKSSIVTDYIGSFIYTIGTIIESLTSKVMSLFTGEKIFPWADKVIFNAVPLLDVNFINPSDGSLLSDKNSILGIGGIVRSIYFTGLSFALGFLGVIVAVMAIKLAISTISSEKAKYKEAITKWLTALVLLFGMHFGLSFIFYLNEQLVELASGILNNVLTEEEHKAISEKIESVSSETKDKTIDNFIKKVDETKNWQALNLKDLISNIAVGIVDGDNAKNIIKDKNNREVVFYLLKDPVILENVIPNVVGNSEKWDWLNAVTSVVDPDSAVGFQILWFADCVEKVNARKNWSDEQLLNRMDECKKTIENPDFLDKWSGTVESAKVDLVICEMAKNMKNGDISKQESDRTYNIFSSLGTFFKDKAWFTDTDKGEWSANSVSVVSALLYTIFVIESLMFFIAYIKRFFYVVVLSVIAPFVIIYDFFVKSATL